MLFWIALRMSYPERLGATESRPRSAYEVELSSDISKRYIFQICCQAVAVTPRRDSHHRYSQYCGLIIKGTARPVHGLTVAANLSSRNFQVPAAFSLSSHTTALAASRGDPWTSTDAKS